MNSCSGSVIRFVYRVYAVTGRNKWIGIVLALLIAAQFCHGTFSIVWIALGPRKSLHHLTVRVRTHQFLVQPFPEINLDPFEVCFYKLWSLGELIYYNLTIAFGKPTPSSLRDCFTPGVLTPCIPHSPLRGIIDLLAFLIILAIARKSRGHRYPGMPSILDVVVRYSTHYFLLIFFSQLLAQLFVFFAPVSDTRYVRVWLLDCAHCVYIASTESSSYRGRKFAFFSTSK